MKTTKLIVSLILLVSLFDSCSHTRRSEIGQGYQNFNSRYNTYFNAKEKFYIGYNAVKNKYKDNYNNILPLYELDNSSEQFMAQTDMNIIEEKAGKVAIKYYTSRWADNAILIWGKTLYLRAEYLRAIKVFTYITAEYKKGFRNEDLRKSKGSKIPKKELKLKEAEKKQIPITEGFFEHSPRRNEAIIWLARSYIQLEKFNEAQAIISYAESDMSFPKEYRTELIKVQADLYIKRKNYAEGLKSLSKLIRNTKSKKLKARYEYISGQIYEITKKSDSAFYKFENVLANKPNYDMEFYARIKLANAASSLDIKKGEEILKKMLKEGKNEDYYDVLFYKLGILYYENKKFDLAEENFRKSIDNSKNNQQKAISFLNLARLYELKENYVWANKFYDSTTSLYDTKLSEYKQIVEHAKIISKLSEQQKIVQDQDSLQYLASMGKEKAGRFLLSSLEQQQKLNQKDKKSDSYKKLDNLKLVGDDKWYFGNQTLLQNGVAEFKKIWGDRKLEDDWRRKNKKIETSSDNDVEKATDSTVAEESFDDIVKKKLKDIPFEKEAMLQSEAKSTAAKYNIGIIYKDDLFLFEKSINTLEALVTNASAVLLPKLYFHLYVNNTLIKNEPRALYYKNLLLKKFPEHELSKSIDKKIESPINNEELYYDSTYNFFNLSKYDTTIERCNLYPLLYPKENFKLKIKLLKAICLGRLYKYDEYIIALNELANKHVDTKEGKMAQDLLARFMNSELKRIEDSTTLKDPKPITYNADESRLAVVGKVDTSSKIIVNNTVKKDTSISLQTTAPPTIKKDTIKTDSIKIKYENNIKIAHSFMIIILNEAKASDIQNKLGTYNTKNFSVLNLKILPLKLDGKTIYLVQEFTDGNKATFYNKFIQADKETLSGLSSSDYQALIISNVNLAKFLPAKDIDGYLKFFKENY